MPIATFNQGTRLGVENERSTAPSSTNTPISGPGGPWWGGGRWFDVVTEGLPGVQEKQAVIFPKGHAGKRSSNQQVPVVGRKWSEGGLGGPVVADFLGALLFGALGGVSTNQVPSTAPSLLNNEPIATNPKSFVLATQPDGGGNILRFDIKAQDSKGGTISISGINAYGFGASELISFASNGLVYSRTSFSSVGASGIAVCGLSAASVTIFGIKRFEHLFFTASSAPTFAIERVATPVAGGPASKAKMHVGMIMKQLVLNTPADDDAGIFNCSTEFEGDPAATCTAGSINNTSPLKIWPAWTLKITRDNGTAWNLAKKFTLNVNAANRNYKTAAGTQHPQGKFVGPVEVTGNLDIILDNEVEYDRWQGASALSAYARWNTDWRLNAVASQNYELGASFDMYFENLAEAEDEEAFSLTGDFRMPVNANWQDGPIQFKLINSTPGTAFGNGNSVA